MQDCHCKIHMIEAIKTERHAKKRSDDPKPILKLKLGGPHVIRPFQSPGMPIARITRMNSTRHSGNEDRRCAYPNGERLGWLALCLLNSFKSHLAHAATAML